MPGIIAYGGYVPRLRLQRKSMVEANAWFNPGLAGYAKGERAICNWDEDAVTMAVAASRDCLGQNPPKLDAVYFASTTLPFQDRQCATLLATALDLPEGLETLDLTTSQRAATASGVTASAAPSVTPFAFTRRASAKWLSPASSTQPVALHASLAR